MNERFKLRMIGWLEIPRVAMTLLCVLLLHLSGCAHRQSTPLDRISSTVFGTLKDGREVTLFELINENGTSVKIADLGGIIVALNTPDQHGVIDDIVLGFDTPQSYLDQSPYFGAIVGRYANRIANGKFSINGEYYDLARNNGQHHIHGGLVGFDKRIWLSKTTQTSNSAVLTLSMISKDGDEGYPGTLEVKVTYELNDNNELRIEYYATTDKPTIINLTQHSYFNLEGHASGSILSHRLKINSDKITPVDKSLIPTGGYALVAGTPFDFNRLKPIGRDIIRDHEQLLNGAGYDHNWVLNHNPNENGLSSAAFVVAQKSGRTLAVLTDQPGLQLYTGNYLDGTIVGKSGAVYNRRQGFCLETQHFPNSPNQSNFPTVRLDPGEEYETTTIFKLGTILTD